MEDELFSVVSLCCSEELIILDFNHVMWLDQFIRFDCFNENRRNVMKQKINFFIIWKILHVKVQYILTNILKVSTLCCIQA